MDTEFINAYIGRQKALIDDLQGRLLLAETKCSLLETKLNDVTEQLTKAEAKKSSKGSNE